MTNKSWPIWVAGIAILALVLAPSPGLLSLGKGVTRAKFKRLRVGMTAQEVEAILGPPTEDVDAATIPIPSKLRPDDAARFKKWKEETVRVKSWRGEGRIFCCHFDNAGRLTYHAYGNPNDEFP